MAGGVERVLTLKANYFAEHYGYDITIILTEGKGKPLFYPLSDKVKIVNLDINFEELWHCSFAKKIVLYLKKQREYKKKVKEQLFRLRPDITVSMLRREINFINSINDGSKKIGELHINRANYRNFSASDTNFIKNLFAQFWSNNLLGHLRKLNRLVVLTEKDREAWHELDNVEAIPNPLPFDVCNISNQESKRLLLVGRYSHEKGIDLMLEAWAKLQGKCSDWTLDIFGDGDREPYILQAKQLGIDMSRCHLNGRTDDVRREYANSAMLVCTSRFEGFGMVIAEAMACGLPVVSFDCPWGPRSIISDGEDGALVTNGNVEELTRSMFKMVNDSELRHEMSMKAVGNIKRFNIDNIAEKWRLLFESL
jgi:glycosyltransferase involved in cell wall biosynthesis